MFNALDFQKAINGDNFGKVVDNSIGGKCSCCGECCSDIIPLLKEEIITLRHFVKKNNYIANTKALKVHGDVYDCTCPFLNAENKCDVYDIRPQICRLFKCWEKIDNSETFCKLPIAKQAQYLQFYSKNPEVCSIRSVVFDEKVPF